MEGYQVIDATGQVTMLLAEPQPPATNVKAKIPNPLAGRSKPPAGSMLYCEIHDTYMEKHELKKGLCPLCWKAHIVQKRSEALQKKTEHPLEQFKYHLPDDKLDRRLVAWGKYEDRTWKWVADHDPAYCRWVLNNHSKHREQSAINFYEYLRAKFINVKGDRKHPGCLIDRETEQVVLETETEIEEEQTEPQTNPLAGGSNPESLRRTLQTSGRDRDRVAQDAINTLVSLLAPLQEGAMSASSSAPRASP